MDTIVSIFTYVTLVKAGLEVGLLHLSVRPSVRNSFWVPSLCNLYLQKFSFLFIQTFYNDCSHIEDVHILFCAHFTTFFFIFEGC